MDLSKENIEEQIGGLAAALSAEPGDDEYFIGVAKTTPFLFKLISAGPLTYMFKLRMRESQNEESDWAETLPEAYATAEIECEIEDDYLFLWVRNASVLTADSIASLVFNCISHHSRLFPKADRYCYQCGNSGSAAIRQSGTAVATVCDDCYAERIDEQEKSAILETASSAIFLLPCALGLGAAGWTAFWYLYDFAFKFAGSGHLPIPQLVLLMVIIGVGYGLGWPTGIVLYRSGVHHRFGPVLPSVVLTTLMVILGEFSFATIVVYRALGFFHFQTVLNNTLPLAFGGNIFYAVIKLIFAAAVGVATYHVILSKRVKLKL